MTPEAPPRPAPPRPPGTEHLGLDREFAAELARMPLLALPWVAAAALAHLAWAGVKPTGLNAGPLVVVCAGMVAAALVDGWALKVPNRITLPLILSGWVLGLLHDLGVGVDAGTGGLGSAVLGTALGFALLFPMLAVRGVGEGDVKMQMGFAAWVCAFFGSGGTTEAAGLGFRLHGLGVVLWAFVFGAVAGGLFGLAMILMRRQWAANAAILRGIGGDLKLFATGGAGEAVRRAEDRRRAWVKLPYGIPLCVGFLLYLGYVLVLPR
ncbi:MAG: prepilin peptidase [Isosphaera sp.]|nr:prepilin peptidase [Isosphaera sp.]